MKKALTLIFILFVISGLHAGTDTSRCNWKNRISRFDVYNNCDSNTHTVNIIGKITLNQNYNCTSPARRIWKLSGNSTTVIGSGENLYYRVTQNGTYTICVSILDSCNKCDTVLCKTVTVNCLGCNWKSKIGSFTVKDNCDSNKNSKHIVGKITLNQHYSCSKPAFRQWSVNKAIVGYGENLYYNITANGTYAICMTLYDSCRKCDTSICKTITVTCFPGCNWKHKVDTFSVDGHCDSMKRTRAIYAQFYLNQNYKCNKNARKKWMVNNTVAGYGDVLYYPVSGNGSYQVCVQVYDSCNNCDTSFCKTVNINCSIAPLKCNWKSRIDQFDAKGHCDTQKRTKMILGKLYLNQHYRCTSKAWKKWIVNNVVAGYGDQLYYPVSNNGNYQVCVVVYDSCDNCDTMLCKTVSVNCPPAHGCNWKSRIGQFGVSGHCDTAKRTRTIYGNLYLNQNYKCTKKPLKKWLVNNTVAGYGDALYYPVSADGTYQVCVVVYDSCDKCDTSLCKTVTFNCKPPRCE